MELLRSSDFEIRTREPRILFWDIETAANKGYVWGKYQQDVIEFDEEWYVLAWSVRYGRKQITKGLQDYEGYKPGDPTNDLELMKDLHSELSKADLFVYHNGDAFDLKKANTRFIEHGLAPIAPKASVDTLKVARRLFKFNSNKLDDLARRLGLERKMQTGGFELWKKSMQGDAKAFNRMKRYCVKISVCKSTNLPLKNISRKRWRVVFLRRSSFLPYSAKPTGFSGFGTRLKMASFMHFMVIRSPPLVIPL